MRSQLEGLVIAVIGGDIDSAWILHDILEGCRDLEPETEEHWSEYGSERRWSEFRVEQEAPGLAFFLPTPEELRAALRRLRLSLIQLERLSLAVMIAIDTYADRSIFYTLVDALEAYDGGVDEFSEIQQALSLLVTACEDVSDEDRLRARGAVEHVRVIGARAIHGGISIADAASACLANDFEESAPQVDPSGPSGSLSPDMAARLDDLRATHSAAWTMDIVVVVASTDYDVVSHLSIITYATDGSGLARPLKQIGARPPYEDGSPWTSLQAPIWIARIAPSDAPLLLQRVATARWLNPAAVQVWLRPSKDSPYDLYVLRDGVMLPTR